MRLPRSVPSTINMRVCKIAFKAHPPLQFGGPMKIVVVSRGLIGRGLRYLEDVVGPRVADRLERFLKLKAAVQHLPIPPAVHRGHNIISNSLWITKQSTWPLLLDRFTSGAAKEALLEAGLPLQSISSIPSEVLRLLRPRGTSSSTSGNHGQNESQLEGERNTLALKDAPSSSLRTRRFVHQRQRAKARLSSARDRRRGRTQPRNSSPWPLLLVFLSVIWVPEQPWHESRASSGTGIEGRWWRRHGSPASLPSRQGCSDSYQEVMWRGICDARPLFLLTRYYYALA